MNKTTASAHGPQGFTQPRWLPLHQALLATALAAALAHGPAWAQAPTPASAAENANPASTPASMAQLPAARTSGKVKYLTGGVGKDESDMIKAESRHWPLTLEFAVRTQGRAQFAAGKHGGIVKAARHEAVQRHALFVVHRQVHPVVEALQVPVDLQFPVPGLDLAAAGRRHGLHAGQLALAGVLGPGKKQEPQRDGRQQHHEQGVEQRDPPGDGPALHGSSRST